MAATAKCLPQVQFCALRVARLNATTGVPVAGAGNMYVSDAATKLTLTPVYTDADEIKEKNGCGSTKVNYKGAPSFDRVDFELELLVPDPLLIEILTSADAISNSTSYGNAAPAIGDITGTYISIEGWAKQINNGVQDATFPYARWAFPGVKNTRLNAWSLENAAQKQVIVGEMYENAGWFDGPTNDWNSTSDRVWQWLPWATLPTVQCGYQAVTAS